MAQLVDYSAVSGSPAVPPVVAGEQHIYHHSMDDAKINVNVEKNSRGYNYSATVTGAKSTTEAILLVAKVMQELEAMFGPKPEAVTSPAVAKDS